MTQSKAHMQAVRSATAGPNGAIESRWKWPDKDAIVKTLIRVQPVDNQQAERPFAANSRRGLGSLSTEPWRRLLLDCLIGRFDQDEGRHLFEQFPRQC